MKEKVDIYSIITDRLIERIEKEQKLPWRQGWTNYLDTSGIPQNFVTKKPYRGINIWLLQAQGFKLPYFLTFKQAQSLKGNIKKGEKGTPVIHWHWFEQENNDPTKKNKKIPSMRYYTVFNIEQTEGIEIPKLEEKPINDVGSLETCELIIQEMPNPPKITFVQSKAVYAVITDTVNLPKKESFKALPEFYSTFFHELVHSTGHHNRLARYKTIEEWSQHMDSDQYAKEELIAEMGAAFLGGYAGIQAEIEDNNVAYLQSWIAKFKKDKKLLIQAAGQAQKAADFILKIKREEETQENA